MRDNIKNVLTRTVSGVALLIAMISATMWSQWSFGAMLLIITCGCTYEFNRMARSLGHSPLEIMGCVASVALFAFAFDGFFGSSERSIPIALFFMALIPLVFAAEVFRTEENPMVNIALTLMPILYIGAPIALLAGIPIQISGGEWSPLVMVSYFFIVWSNDSFAYLAGITCGKHLLCEKLSPKKTWEGFVGGVVGSIGVAAIVAHLLNDSVVMWIGIAVIASISGVLGDLVESKFKRATNMKDSGSLMPGHGGWLDRFDSLLLSSPFVFVYLLIISLLTK
ncbi:MAG: phosphatidate cytidylyltransferase [Rikenellaceae bacterium]